MSALLATLYEGIFRQQRLTDRTPQSAHLPAIWCFCKSPEYNAAVRRIDQKMNVTNATLVKVPFDLERWQQVAAEEYPDGLPEPHSDDPTQWLFRGHPKGSTDPLQVAVARLLGYRWPEQEPDDLDRLADADGIVPLPAVRGEPPAAERLQEVLLALRAEETNHRGTEAQRRENQLEDSLLISCPLCLCGNDLLTAAGAGRGPRSTPGSATASSSSTASGSTTAPSSGTSGTAATTASPAWSTTTSSPTRRWRA